MTTAEVEDTPALCEGLQHEEYEVLESIYPECISNEMTNKSLRLEIPVEFGAPRIVRVEQDTSLTQCDSPSVPPLDLSLSSLPPITLNVVLPALYPMNEPPTLTSIRAAHFWLPQTSRLHQVLTGLWQPGEGVLYTWIELLRNGDFFDAVNLLDDNDDIRFECHLNGDQDYPSITPDPDQGAERFRGVLQFFAIHSELVSLLDLSVNTSRVQVRTAVM
ncbi:hypothetical protein C0993_007449 [Termitomyces sp. T159_Od127]|nr:hypothetical protein C0993_007449 [Termitomyces sp. T159_Od127]